MRLLFSECAPDYAAAGPVPGVGGAAGSGDAGRSLSARASCRARTDLSHFYLARSVRVRLDVYTPPSRVRYAARRCADLSPTLTPATEFAFDASWRALVAGYFTARWGGSGFDADRFTRLLRSPLTTHVLTLVNAADATPAAVAALYLEPDVATTPPPRTTSPGVVRGSVAT